MSWYNRRAVDESFGTRRARRFVEDFLPNDATDTILSEENSKEPQVQHSPINRKSKPKYACRPSLQHACICAVNSCKILVWKCQSRQSDRILAYWSVRMRACTRVTVQKSDLKTCGLKGRLGIKRSRGGTVAGASIRDYPEIRRACIYNHWSFYFSNFNEDAVCSVAGNKPKFRILRHMQLVTHTSWKSPKPIEPVCPSRLRFFDVGVRKSGIYTPSSVCR